MNATSMTFCESPAACTPSVPTTFYEGALSRGVAWSQCDHVTSLIINIGKGA